MRPTTLDKAQNQQAKINQEHYWEMGQIMQCFIWGHRFLNEICHADVMKCHGNIFTSESANKPGTINVDTDTVQQPAI